MASNSNSNSNSSSISSFLSNKYYFISILLLLLLHLGCFIFTSHNNNKGHHRTNLPPHQPTISINSKNHKKRKPHRGRGARAALSSPWSFIKRIVSSSYCRKSYKPPPGNANTSGPPPAPAPTTTFLSSSSPMVSSASPSETHWSSSRRRPDEEPADYTSSLTTDINTDNPSSSPLFFRNTNNILLYPCPTCGEIFQKQLLLEQHQSERHALTELFDGDSGKNIVAIIFQTGWNNNQNVKNHPVTISRILKIHNSPKILKRFEEYRESVKAKAARSSGGLRKKRIISDINEERCLADGNELLRFHCTTSLCGLLNSSPCSLQYCSLCGIIRSGFSPKMDGISTLSTSWRAHLALPEDIEQEFRFMNLQRAMLVCRVVAGRVGCDPDDEVDKEEEDGGGAYDSVVGRGPGNGIFTRADEDELLVFNPRAVLPCFVIIYDTTPTSTNV